jgi:hypothetical protein
MITPEWSEWRQFPDPRKREMLIAPFGPGCYELRHGTQLVLHGTASHVAGSMTSLLPRPFGSYTRINHHKRNYVFDHLGSIEYRTLACATLKEAKNCQRDLRIKRADHIFQT